MTGAAQDGTSAEVISLEDQRIRRRIRRRMREFREARERERNDPAAEERQRRITEIAEIVIEEVLGPGRTT